MFTQRLKPFLTRSSNFQQLFRTMAKSRYEYVKNFEVMDKLDPRHWIVIKISCSDFEDLVLSHSLQQPTDERLTSLMTSTAKEVMETFKEIQMSYGFREEFNFVFKKETTLYNRRASKLLTNVCSLMGSAFVHKWEDHINSIKLKKPPLFQGSVYLYADDQSLRDHCTSCQRKCHIQNLHNRVFWALVLQKGLSYDEAKEQLKTAKESDKNEILFSQFGVNYNNEPVIFRKGNILLRKRVCVEIATSNGQIVQRMQSTLVDMVEDFTCKSFWVEEFPLQSETVLNGKQDYLRDFDKDYQCLPHSWIVVRIDGKGFHKFSDQHGFLKPNDTRSLELMNRAAKNVINHFSGIVLAYGQSDEYSFIVDRYSKLCGRKAFYLMSSIVGLFGATYVFYWKEVFTKTPIHYCPAFDGRVVVYPNKSCIRDYLTWRQVDCHINNLYNTTFWTLVQHGNYSRREAQEKLSGTFSKDKKDILLEFGVDYGKEDPLYCKGTVMYKPPAYLSDVKDQDEKPIKDMGHIIPVTVDHIDIIRDEFWNRCPWLLSTERSAACPDLDDL